MQKKAKWLSEEALQIAMKEGKQKAKEKMPGASTGVPSHDKVMQENSDGQSESELERPPPPPDLPERLPQNQNLSVLLFYDFHQLF